MTFGHVADAVREAFPPLPQLLAHRKLILCLPRSLPLRRDPRPVALGATNARLESEGLISVTAGIFKSYLGTKSLRQIYKSYENRLSHSHWD